VTAVILGIFALATVVLVQARQLMREIARTLKEWRKLKKALHSKNTCDDRTSEENPNKIQP
jgi:hypothetical protein